MAASYVKVLRCEECGTKYIPPKYVCINCGSEKLTEEELKGEYKIYSYTTIFVPPEEFKDQAPYDLVVIDLGDGMRVTGRLIKAGKEPKIGEKVNFVKKDEFGYWFEIA